MIQASIIVPTYNRANRLRRLLDALERQDAATASFEVVVCDDGSIDETPAVLAQPRPYALTALRRANGGPGAARNDAIRAATGDVLIFFDDDVEPERDAVRLHTEAHAHDRALVVLGAMHAHAEVRTPWIAWELRTLARQYDNMTRGVYAPTARQFFTANASVRKEHVIGVGLFDETFRRAEDVELALRLEDRGLRFAFRPGIRISHDPARSLPVWKRIARQYGEYDVAMWRSGLREDILRRTASEFRERSRIVRAATRGTAGRQPVISLLSAVMMTAARAAYSTGLKHAGIAACSIVFNIEYYNGFARALGGRAAFWSAIDHPAPAATEQRGAERHIASLKSGGGS